MHGLSVVPFLFRCLILMLFLLGSAQKIYAKPLVLDLWHSLAGDLGVQFLQITKQFNQSQEAYHIHLVYKGEYTDSLTSFAAAFRAKRPPAMIQIQEVGTAVVLNPPGIIKPVEDLIKTQHLRLSKKSFFPAINSFYSDKGALQAMPFNISVPVLYYNADILARFGINETNFPKTWQELEPLLFRFKKAGYSCGYTAAYPTWIHIESFLALHGLSLIDPAGNRVNANNPALLGHVQRLKKWHQLKLFVYGGRRSEATVLFTSAICPLFAQSSGAYNSLVQTVPFKLSVAQMPLDAEYSQIRHANVPGGAAIWVVSGQSEDEYKGIASFFSFLARPATQSQWHNNTGYLPLGLTGVYSNIKKDNKHSVLGLVQDELVNKNGIYPSYYKGPQNQIRSIFDEALEDIFSNIKNPEPAFMDVSDQAHYLLNRFLMNSGRTKNQA